VLGLTFKENVGDIRNTKVVDIISELAEYGVESLVFDPYANAEEVIHEYGDILRSPQSGDTIPNSSNSGHVPRLLTGHVPGLLTTGHVPGLLVPALEAVPAVDAVILAVPHEKFIKELTLDKLAGFCKKDAAPVIIDIKGVFEPQMATKQGIRYWRL